MNNGAVLPVAVFDSLSTLNSKTADETKEITLLNKSS